MIFTVFLISDHADIYVSQNTNLDRQSLSYCVSLIENGVNPDALAVSLPV